MIPKRIFYCWITKDESNPSLPSQFNIALSQWKSICKVEEGWEYILVNWEYMKSRYSKDVISEMRRINDVGSPAEVADYCRMVVTINEGGFYMDLDTIISPKFLDLVNSGTPIISARPGMDLQFMCHPGINKIPKSLRECNEFYKDYGKMIVGNYTFFSPSHNHNYLRNKINRSLNWRLSGIEFEIVDITDFTYDGKHTISMCFFYFNQPLFHFNFNSHDGIKSGFEDEFNKWNNKFLTYYINHHD